MSEDKVFGTVFSVNTVGRVVVDIKPTSGTVVKINGLKYFKPDDSDKVYAIDTIKVFDNFFDARNWYLDAVTRIYNMTNEVSYRLFKDVSEYQEKTKPSNEEWNKWKRN